MVVRHKTQSRAEVTSTQALPQTPGAENCLLLLVGAWPQAWPITMLDRHVLRMLSLLLDGGKSYPCLPTPQTERKEEMANV